MYLQQSILTKVNEYPKSANESSCILRGLTSLNSFTKIHEKMKEKRIPAIKIWGIQFEEGDYPCFNGWYISC